MKILLACLVLLIGGIALAAPKQVDLSDNQVRTIQFGIHAWCFENLDDPADIKHVGFWDATENKENKGYINFKASLRVTNSQGIKKLHRLQFIVNPDTGHILDGKAF